MAGFDDHVPSQWASTQFSIAHITLSSFGLSVSLNGVYCSLVLYGMRLCFNHGMNFVLPRSICVLLEINFMHFVLYDIIVCLYYWNFITSWNQIDGVHSKLILLFMAVSAVVNVETRSTYYFLRVLDKRWMGRTYWSYTKMRRKEKPRRQLLWISAQK